MRVQPFKKLFCKKEKGQGKNDAESITTASTWHDGLAGLTSSSEESESEGYELPLSLLMKKEGATKKVGAVKKEGAMIKKEAVKKDRPSLEDKMQAAWLSTEAKIERERAATEDLAKENYIVQEVLKCLSLPLDSESQKSMKKSGSGPDDNASACFSIRKHRGSPSGELKSSGSEESHGSHRSTPPEVGPAASNVSRAQPEAGPTAPLVSTLSNAPQGLQSQSLLDLTEGEVRDPPRLENAVADMMLQQLSKSASRESSSKQRKPSFFSWGKAKSNRKASFSDDSDEISISTYGSSVMSASAKAGEPSDHSVYSFESSVYTDYSNVTGDASEYTDYTEDILNPHSFASSVVPSMYSADDQSVGSVEMLLNHLVCSGSDRLHAVDWID